MQPGWINSLAKLTHIYMDNNKLSTFPAEICELKGLEVLCAPRNSITDIPSTIAALKRLTQLNLSHNRIRNVPGGKSLCVLQKKKLIKRIQIVSTFQFTNVEK